ncbi:MAG: DEAD/DEAH box helicase [Shewanella sp.]
MQLIHLFWQPDNSTFDNTGQIYLWVESQDKITSPKFYPYQLSSCRFIGFTTVELKMNSAFEEVEVSLPCNAQGEATASPIIANINNLDDNRCSKFKPFILNAIQVDEPIIFLKELNFQSYHFEEDLILADDAKFWIKMAYEFSHMIKQDQYIPALVAQRNTVKTQYHTKWLTISSEYHDRLQMISDHMPHSACLGDFSNFDTLSALHHFSDVNLNKLITGTPYTQKNIKSVEHTFIAQALNNQIPSIDAYTFKTWKLWQNNLTYDQFGADFTLCFKLLEASDQHKGDWGLELLLQSKRDPSFMINLTQYRQDKITKQQIFTELLGISIERTLLLQLGYASRIYAIIEHIFETKMQEAVIPLDQQQAFQFLKEDAWTLHACGYRIIVPAWWTSKGRLKAKVKLRAHKNTTSASNSPTGFISADSLIQFDYRYSMGEHELSEDQWLQLLEAKSDLVYFRGNWIEIDKTEMEKIQKLIETSRKDMNSGNMQKLLTLAADESSYYIELDVSMKTIIDELKNKDKFSLISQPPQLQAELRPYQNRGTSWLAYLENLGMNPCLADDMGLGKTMQIIALMLLQPRKQAALLVAPTTVVGNWLKEIQKFAPSLNAVVHHGNQRKQKQAFSKLVSQHDLIITSYGLIRKDKALFKEIHWSRLIIDEAQNIKNPASTQTKVLYGLSADSRIALTGTPIENRLMDLWSIFNFLNPGLLGTQAHFRKNFELPVQRDNNLHQSQLLKNIVEPFILRRLKTDKNIITDLPDKIEQKVYCELSTEQASIYQSIVDEITEQIEQTPKTQGQKMIMLSALLRLKQCCNHPAQVLQDGSEFSIDRSVKLQRLVEISKEAIRNNESILIFSQFTEVCSQINKIFKNKLGFQTYYLHGATSRNQREKMIQQFQAEDSPPAVFILSLKAGGVGITLTKANHVIHFDRWWNPAVEDQATDRAYRIGQQKTVFAHKFITIGTIEEKIDKMLEDKKKIANSIVGNNESWLSELDANSFIKLIQLSQEV